MIKTIKDYFSVEWKDKYEAKRKECDSWEFKFNKLQGQLAAILKEAEK